MVLYSSYLPEAFGEDIECVLLFILLSTNTVMPAHHTYFIYQYVY